MAGRDPRRPLAALRYSANLAIDGPFADVAAAVEAIVAKRAQKGADGVLRLDALGAAMVRLEVRALLADREAELAGAIGARVLAAEALAERQARGAAS